MSLTQGLCEYKGSLYAAWKGDVGDQNLYCAVLNGNVWENKDSLPGKSSVGPALVTANGLIYAAWREAGDDENLYYALITRRSTVVSGQTGSPFSSRGRLRVRPAASGRHLPPEGIRSTPRG